MSWIWLWMGSLKKMMMNSRMRKIWKKMIMKLKHREGEIKEGDAGGVKDEFFNLEEMRLMEDDEEGDYGLNKTKQAAKKTGRKYEEDDEEDNFDDDDEEEEDEDDDEIGLLELAGDGDDSGVVANR